MNDEELHTISHVSHTHQFSSVAQLYLTLCDPMDYSRPGLPVHRQLPEFTQIHVHWVNDAIQPSHPLLSPSPPAFNLFQHQGLFRWVSSSHQVAKVLEFQLKLIHIYTHKNTLTHLHTLNSLFFFFWKRCKSPLKRISCFYNLLHCVELKVCIHYLWGKMFT